MGGKQVETMLYGGAPLVMDAGRAGGGADELESLRLRMLDYALAHAGRVAYEIQTSGYDLFGADAFPEYDKSRPQEAAETRRYALANMRYMSRMYQDLQAFGVDELIAEGKDDQAADE